MKHLYRSNNNKVVAGVCGGLAEYFNVDPVIPRIIFLLIALPGGISILAYFIFWIVMPKQPVLTKVNKG
jgi:phage shock protein C